MAYDTTPRAVLASLSAFLDARAAPIPFAVDPNSEAYATIKNGILDERTRWQFGSWELMSRTQLRTELGPILRLIEPILLDPSVLARCGQMDICQVINRVNKVYVEGAGASENAVLVNILAWMYGAIRYVEKYGGPLLVIVDEAGNFGIPGRGFFTNRVLRAIASLEKYGLEFCFITQTIHSLEPEIQSYLLDNARRIVCYGIGSPETARIMTEVMGTPRLDPNEISHTTSTWRQLHDGYDHDDGRSRYYQFEEEQEHRRSFGDQLKLTQQSLMSLSVGQRYVNEGGRVWKETLPRLDDPYPWGLSDRHLEHFKQSMEFNPWFTKANYAFPRVIPRARSETKRSRRG